MSDCLPSEPFSFSAPRFRTLRTNSVMVPYAQIPSTEVASEDCSWHHRGQCSKMTVLRLATSFERLANDFSSTFPLGCVVNTDTTPNDEVTARVFQAPIHRFRLTAPLGYNLSHRTDDDDDDSARERETRRDEFGPRGSLSKRQFAFSQ